jgi:putative transposase
MGPRQKGTVPPMTPPRGPRPTRVCLTDAERQELDTLVRRHTTPQQLALRARIVLAAADGFNHAQIARQEGVSLDTARLWRRRWLATAPADASAPSPVATRLRDLPRPGAPAHFTAEQFCQLTALACEIPEGSDRPISQWSQREIAEEAIQRGIFESISPRHVGRFLKGGRPQAPPDPLLADAASHRTRGGASGQNRRHLHPLSPSDPKNGRRRTDYEHG